MPNKLLIASLVAGTLAIPAILASAADQTQTQTKDQTQTRERDPIYGSQLMTPEERAEHRKKMRSLKTAKEREEYRLEHHKKMQARAKEKGITLPDEPPMPGGRMMGPGGGPGPMGPGGGPMGPGGGR